MYKLILFDLDGTLADTSEGIYGAYYYSCEQLGIILDKDSLKGVIGGNLLRTFEKRFGLTEEKARKAVSIYREWYEKEGIWQVKLYSGIKEVLCCLSKKYTLGVATLKREDFAKKMLNMLGIDKYFQFICGMDKDDSLNKELILRKCMQALNTSSNATLLIGDSESDYNGAKSCNIDFMAVTYGFGFDRHSSFKNGEIIGLVNQTIDILQMI